MSISRSPPFPSGDISATNVAIADNGTLSIGSQTSAFKAILSAPASMTEDITLTFPLAQGTPGQVLSTFDEFGLLNWSDPGVSQATVTTELSQLNGKAIAQLIGFSNVTLSGTQTIDGVSTSGASIVCLSGQTDPTENGLWSVDDFLPWTRPLGWSDGIGRVPGSIVSVSAAAGGVTYSDTLWFGTGDGSTTASYKQILFPLSQYVTPATGATVTVAINQSTTLFINPAGTIAALTINFPSSPANLTRVQLGTSQTITGLTLGNGTFLGALTTLAAGGFATYIYSSGASKWFRMG